MIASACGQLFLYTSSAGVVADGELQSYTTPEYKKTAIRLAAPLDGRDEYRESK
jgi:hypothetical protein